MRLKIRLAALVALGACGGGQSPPAQPVPLAAEEAPAAVDPVPIPEPEPSARDRWEAPFAVSSTGVVQPLEPRPVTVLSADSTIASGLAQQRAVQLADPRPAGSGSSGGGQQPEPSQVAGSGNSSVEGRVARGGGTNTAPDPVRSGGSPQAGLDRNAEPTVAVRAGASVAADREDNSPALTHVVQRDETWLGIAIAYGVSSRELAAVNPTVDPERIRSGQTLRLPSGATPPAEPRRHRVRPGDTLSEIAEEYGVSAAELRRLNGLTNDRIRLDQTLLIPAE